MHLDTRLSGHTRTHCGVTGLPRPSAVAGERIQPRGQRQKLGEVIEDQFDSAQLPQLLTCNHSPVKPPRYRRERLQAGNPSRARVGEAADGHTKYMFVVLQEE